MRFFAERSTTHVDGETGESWVMGAAGSWSWHAGPAARQGPQRPAGGQTWNGDGLGRSERRQHARDLAALAPPVYGGDTGKAIAGDMVGAVAGLAWGLWKLARRSY